MYILKITLKTYNVKQFLIPNKFLKKLDGFFKKNNCLIITNQPLKKIKKKYTILKSPHVHKKSRDQYLYQQHQRLIIMKCTKLFPLLLLNHLFFQLNFNNLIIKSKLKKKCL